MHNTKLSFPIVRWHVKAWMVWQIDLMSLHAPSFPIQSESSTQVGLELKIVMGLLLILCWAKMDKYIIHMSTSIMLRKKFQPWCHHTWLPVYDEYDACILLVYSTYIELLRIIFQIMLFHCGTTSTRTHGNCIGVTFVESKGIDLSS